MSTIGPPLVWIAEGTVLCEEWREHRTNRGLRMRAPLEVNGETSPAGMRDGSVRMLSTWQRPASAYVSEFRLCVSAMHSTRMRGRPVFPARSVQQQTCTRHAPATWLAMVGAAPCGGPKAPLVQKESRWP
jgi:hypothetical protein